MEAFVVVALIAVALLIAELLLPTGGILATLGVLGLIAGGVLALESDSSEADWIGPALIALGVLCGLRPTSSPAKCSPPTATSRCVPATRR